MVEDSSFTRIRGGWFHKTAKQRPDSLPLRKQRQLTDLWSQVCTLSLAGTVGIVVPEVLLMISPYWAYPRSNEDGEKSIRATLCSKKINSFIELSHFYHQISGRHPKEHIYEQPQLILDQLSSSEKFALGRLLATALWLGHWDLANNIDCANAGFKVHADKDMVEPVLIDGGNALDEGFHGYTKAETFSLFSSSIEPGSPRSLTARIHGYQHTRPFDETIYPFLPRLLLDQKKFFWADKDIMQGLICQARRISKTHGDVLEAAIKSSWQRIIDNDGLPNHEARQVVYAALRRTKSRWVTKETANSRCKIIDILLKRGQALSELANRIQNNLQKKPPCVLDPLLLKQLVEIPFKARI